MEHKSSIHFRPVKGNSESHNFRMQKLNYVHSELSMNNEHKGWLISDLENSDTIKFREKDAKKVYASKNTRKLQKNSSLIREAVVNIKSDTTMDDLRSLRGVLRDEFNINISRYTYIEMRV